MALAVKGLFIVCGVILKRFITNTLKAVLCIGIINLSENQYQEVE